MKFSVHCFEIPFDKGTKGYRGIDKSAFWENAESKVPEIKKGKGVYVFALRRSKGYLPFYVGKTNNSFGAEALQSHKLLHYSNCINDECGTPVIFFVALRTEAGKLSTKDNKELFDWLESYLIGMALMRNDKLLNISKTKFLRNISIPSLIGGTPGANTKDSSLLRKTLL